MAMATWGLQGQLGQWVGQGCLHMSAMDLGHLPPPDHGWEAGAAAKQAVSYGLLF
jgi:hypothetical protein